MWKNNCTIIEGVLDETIINFNVFSTFIKNKIFFVILIALVLSARRGVG